MRTLFCFIVLAYLTFILPANAQNNPVRIKTDTVRTRGKIKKADTLGKKQEPIVFKDSARLAIEKMPRTAVWRSALVPGLGQIYNKRWWKVPFIYAGFVGVGLALDFNQRYYKEFLGEVQYRSAHDGAPLNPLYAGYSFEGMVQVKDAYRRNRDLSILGFVAVHAINMIDAYVDAKFFRYDISKDLSFKFEPSFQKPNAYASQAFSIKIKLAL
jgi:hypothetical protein